MKCEKCDREFSEKEAHKHTSKVRVYRGKIVCEDCLLGMGVHLDDAEPYWAYIKLHTDIRTPKLHKDVMDYSGWKGESMQKGGEKYYQSEPNSTRVRALLTANELRLKVMYY